jgi:cyclopropane fatty-acyl-phospholipid synthase-like methyltransferase
MTARPDAPAAGRNRGPILEVLRIEFKDVRTVLEVGSGTGQHAVYFASALPHIQWQTSDLADNHDGISAWIEWSALDNVAAPLLLDMAAAHSMHMQFDAVYSSNTAHIMSAALVENMFTFVGKILHDDGIFCLYGPFNEGGEFSSESNARFDGMLRSEAGSMGIRDLDDLNRHAANGGLSLARRYAMPANNQIIIWKKD